jgi:hypothetical protein
MVGTFNWGPALVARRVTSESDLAAVFGKPTLDPSDTSSEADFFAAANFLKYSNNLKVVRLLQGTDYNSASTDVGVTGINSLTHPTIKNIDEFSQLGGFSGYDGIESVAHFRGRYPGNFGDSLRVLVWDGATYEDITTGSLSTGFIDYAIKGGYSPVTAVGITTGTMGYTANAYNYTFGATVIGTTSGTINYFMVSFLPRTGQTPEQLINQLRNDSPEERRNALNFLYATGTTTANATLAANDPSGNRANYHRAIETPSFGALVSNVPLSPFVVSPKTAYTFARVNPDGECVDVIFPDADASNLLVGITIGFPYPGLDPIDPNNVVQAIEFTGRSGVPAHFNDFIFWNAENTSEAYQAPDITYIRTQLAPYVRNNMFVSSNFPNTTLKGMALLVGLTGGITFRNYLNTAIPVTFDEVGGATGVRRDFQFGMKQFGYDGTISTPVTTQQGFGSAISIFTKVPNTSAYALSEGGSNDEISFAVIDSGGKFGPKNSILERFELLSKAVDCKNLDGESIYYKDYINYNSNYVYMTKSFGLSGGGNASSDATTTFGDIVHAYKTPDGQTYTRKGFYEAQLDYGQAGVTNVDVGEYTEGYKLFADDDFAVDILFVPESSLANDSVTSQTTIENIAYDTVIEPRKDTILVLPTPKPTSINQHTAETTSRTIDFRKNKLGVPPNSYTILVAGRKLFFDTFNNQIRKMSLASDVAGILSAQEIAWESPAGFERGMLKNSIRLETKFTKADRDDLYKNGINFFQEFSDGSGTALFGDKTMLNKPSAFDRINVRRVFIALERAIAKAAKFSLFEFNDEFTRSQFRNLVIPFLRSIQSQRGIADFKVVCDSTNNTADVIDRNQFVADIYIKPLKSINFIQLNFIAVRSDFTFSTTE